jgi:hypothetical protein
MTWRTRFTQLSYYSELRGTTRPVVDAFTSIFNSSFTSSFLHEPKQSEAAEAAAQLWIRVAQLRFILTSDNHVMMESTSLLTLNNLDTHLYSTILKGTSTERIHGRVHGLRNSLARSVPVKPA